MRKMINNQSLIPYQLLKFEVSVRKAKEEKVLLQSQKAMRMRSKKMMMIVILLCP
jgi:hypothetical protein